MALFRAAAALGLLFVLAPEQTREAVASIWRGASAARQSASQDAAQAALAYCRKHPEVCAGMGREALRTQEVVGR